MNDKPQLNFAGATPVVQPSCCASTLPDKPPPTACAPDADAAQLPHYVDSSAFTTGIIETPAGPVPRVATMLDRRDRLGTIKVRLNIGRSDYAIHPGLYAVGDPDARSPVLVSANYKLSFDALRRELAGRDLWILVLETFGVNVWCAAGKKTFGTAELVARIEATGLAGIVEHRQLILPQLGAPGIAAHEVKRLSGFTALYGPIKASDLPYFLDHRLKATPEMRRKGFTFAERAVLIPVELVYAVKIAAPLALAFLLLSAIGSHGGYGASLLYYLPATVAIFGGSVLGGAVIVPLLLPWLPGRAFSVKGLIVALAPAAGLLFYQRSLATNLAGLIELIAATLMIAAITTYLALNFTGASTYTSLSGVKKEMRLALPLQIAAGAGGLLIWFAAKFI